MKALKSISHPLSWLVAVLVVTNAFSADTSKVILEPQWRVRDVAESTTLIAALADGTVPGMNLKLESSFGPSGHVCVVTDTTGTERAVTLALVFNLDASGWTWWDDAEATRDIGINGNYSNVTSWFYDANPEFSRYPLAVVSNSQTGVCIAVPPDPGRAARFVYDASAHELRAEFDFGLSPLTEHFPGAADATVIAFETPTKWAFRNALAQYYDRYDADLHRRAGNGGGLLRGAALDTISNASDFHFAWHDFDPRWVSLYDWSHYDQENGVESYMYREPQTHWRGLRGSLSETYHVDFNNGSSGTLAADGNVQFNNGKAQITNSAALRIPGFPTSAPQDLDVEFTICNLDAIVARPIYDVGLMGKFLCGLRKTSATNNIGKVGAFDYWSQGTQNGTPIGENQDSRVTIKAVTRVTDNLTHVYAGFGDDARNGSIPGNLHILGVFPWGGWSSESGYTLDLRNWSGITVEIDDVIVTRYGTKPEGSYANYLSQLQEDAQRGDTEAQATLVSGAFVANGNYDLYLENIVWAAAAPFGINPAPGVRDTGFSGWPNKYEWLDDFLSYYLGWNGSESVMDGMYYDSLQGWGNLRNYRKEHWRTTEYPLTFDRTNNNAVCMQNIWGTVACAKEISVKLHRHGQKFQANDAYFQLWFNMPFVDIGGREMSNYVDGQWSQPSDETYLYWRTCSARRPFWTLMNDPYDDTHDPDIATNMELYFQRSLFYAVFPGMYWAHDGVSPWYWATSEYYDRDRHLFIKYMPMIQKLDLAGWEPVPNAEASVSGIRIERYGNADTDNLAFTLHNTHASQRSFTLELDLVGLGASLVTAVTEWIENKPIAVTHSSGKASLPITLPANGYSALGVETTTQIAADIDGSGQVDARDIQLVINSEMGISVSHDCDVNGDNVLDAADVQVVVVSALESND